MGEGRVRLVLVLVSVERGRRKTRSGIEPTATLAMSVVYTTPVVLLLFFLLLLPHPVFSGEATGVMISYVR